ncbi:aldehyde dehydrogenase family protein [Pseudonocardia sp. NPDC046786]|uniref:aldehyde dehydrogenase family protein n=1 Tax=Pseudonocardia sp. NPDC046786 TaxID=3155471 RepID=UPI0033E63573
MVPSTGGTSSSQPADSAAPAASASMTGREPIRPMSTPRTGMGPLVSAAHRRRVEDHLRAGRAEGTTVVAGGGRPDDLDPALRNGNFLEPTVLVGADRSARVVQEEIFGPVLVVLP